MSQQFFHEIEFRLLVDDAADDGYEPARVRVFIAINYDNLLEADISVEQDLKDIVEKYLTKHLFKIDIKNLIDKNKKEECLNKITSDIKKKSPSRIQVQLVVMKLMINVVTSFSIASFR